MRHFIFVLFILNSAIYFSQVGINAKILQKTFRNYHVEPNPKRKILNVKATTFLVKINPLTYLGAGSIFMYQRILSEQIQANCNYSVSCSNCAKIYMEKKGPIRGFLLGLNQMSCCFGGVSDDHEPCVINQEGKIDFLKIE